MRFVLLALFLWAATMKLYSLYPSFRGSGNKWCAVAMAQVIGLLYDKVTHANFEETTLPAMLGYTICIGIRSGWLDNYYQSAADRKLKAASAKLLFP